jgi:hypothetical protein
MKHTHKRHECCPSEWRQFEDVSGDYDLDANIAKNTNKDMHIRVHMQMMGNQESYMPRAAYNGYSGYHGDD